MISTIVEHPALRKDYGAVLYESLTILAQRDPVNAAFASILLQKLQSVGLARTAEGVAIWLMVTRLFPTATLPKNVWYHNDPLHAKERAALAKILRETNNTESSESSQSSNSKSGAAQNMPSFAWTPVLNQLYTRFIAGQKVIDFENFWNEAVDSVCSPYHVSFHAFANDHRRIFLD